MGIAVDKEHFDAEDRRRFSARLQAGLVALGELLRRPGFGEGPSSIGAEVEFTLVGRGGRPMRLSRTVLSEIREPRLTVELNQYNLELNTRPKALAGTPLTALGGELEEVLQRVASVARRHGAEPVLIGILPTLREEDLSSDAMTDAPRFRALSAEIRRLRHAPFELHISGEDPLVTKLDDVTAEGANTSLQLHLRVDPADFARTHSAAQIATAPALAAAGNSPLLLGHRLWEETRIALFKQAVDDRDERMDAWHAAPRVSFGHGWIREGAHELFAESVALHSPLLPAVGAEDPLACLRDGGVPGLDELRLHHGTVWRWNRAIYDPVDGGHLRIELRALPSGPSIPDMVANVAFLLGLTFGLRDEMEWILPAFPFEHAHHNFYRAAQHGLGATLMWPSRDAPSPRPVGAAELVRGLLPVAHAGLLAAGVEDAEAVRWLSLLEARVANGQTGAQWQRRMLALLERRSSRDEALAELVDRYQAASASGRPVHEWSVSP